MEKLKEIGRLFLEIVNSKPNNFCISSIKSDYSFKEANDITSKWANYLKEKFTLKNDDAVVICSSNYESLSLITIALLKIDVKIIFLDSLSEKALDQICQSRKSKILLITDEALLISIDNKSYTSCSFENLFSDAATSSNKATFENNWTFFQIFDVEESSYLQINTEKLITALDSLDQRLKLADSDAVLFSGKLNIAESVIEILYYLTRGNHLIFNLEKPEMFFEDIEGFQMDFSLFYFGSYSKKIDPADKYSLLINSVKHGDENKYTAVWTPERHFNEFGGLFPNPSVLGSALAVLTSDIQIRAGSLVSPLHHSVRIAEDWSIIDNLSKGRAALSFASGWQCDDFIFYPERYESRHHFMLQQIQDVEKLWKGDQLEYTNGLGKKINVELFPKPIQPKLPIWVTVSGKTESFIDAGKIGANILTHLLWQDTSELKDKIAAYRKSLNDSGFDPDSKIVSVMLHTFVGDNNDEVKDLVREPLKEYIRSSVHLIEAMTRSNEGDGNKDSIGRYGNVHDKIPQHLLDELVEIAFNRFFDQAALLGSFEKCHQMLKKLKSYGVNELACLLDFGLDKDAILEGLEKLSKLKQYYNPRITKKYKIDILRVASSFEIIENSNLSEKMVNLKKVVLSENSFSSEPLFDTKVIHLGYNFTSDKFLIDNADDFIAEETDSKYDELLQVNAAISEDF